MARGDTDAERENGESQTRVRDREGDKTVTREFLEIRERELASLLIVVRLQAPR